MHEKIIVQKGGICFENGLHDPVLSLILIGLTLINCIFINRIVISKSLDFIDNPFVCNDNIYIFVMGFHGDQMGHLVFGCTRHFPGSGRKF